MKPRSDRQAIALATLLSVALCTGMSAVTVHMIILSAHHAERHTPGQAVHVRAAERPQNTPVTPQDQ